MRPAGGDMFKSQREAGMNADLCQRLEQEIAKAYIGKKADIEALMIALLTGGHVLIEGMPGLAKTTLARALSQAVEAKMTRVQFTADLMPSDITGSNIYNMAQGEFKFIEGPIFTNILLADEINRAPARTQSALLEAMQETQVSVDGKTHALQSPFFVIATQNTIDERGVYPLPLSQIDRFLFRIRLTYPTAEQEERVLMQSSQPQRVVEPVLSPKDFKEIAAAIDAIYVSPAIARYVSQIVRATRSHASARYGASPRAGVMMVRAARGRAFLEKRDYVCPDDVAQIACYALNHRIETVSPSASADDVISDVLAQVAFE